MAKGTTIRMWHRSIFVLVVLIVMGFGVIVFRLAYLQLIQGEKLQQMAIDQQLKDTKINAQRGTIYDRNMKTLAQSATVWTVVLESAFLKDDQVREKIANGLSEILQMDKNEILEKAKKKSSYVIIKRKIENDVKDKIVEFQKNNKFTTSIRLIEDYKRYYPYGDFASCVIGFAGTDGQQGLAGLESSYNQYLKGKSGRLVAARNAVGLGMPYNYEQMIPAENGCCLVTCLDEVVQRLLEKSLEEGIVNNKVMNRAGAIMMDVTNGEILGMAVKDGFDLNDPYKLSDAEIQQLGAIPEGERSKARAAILEARWRNKIVSDTYMPGSVFKQITTAMAFEENLIDEKTNFNCTGSFVPFNGARPIKCHKHGGHGSQLFERAFCNSCNPAFIQVGQRVGDVKFYEYYRNFGFTEKTGIDLPGEANGIFFSKDGKMGPMDLAVASFGQNFSITPIQMVTACAAIANGGHLIKPHIVKQIIDTNGNIVKNFDKIEKRQVISQRTSERICALLRQNAIDGGAKNAYIPGYRIGGKTGTTQKIGNSGPGGMDYIASFCGIAPADSPKYILLIYYDTPKGANYYGSFVAAPTFAKSMQEILPYLNVEQRYTDEEIATLDVTVPFLVGSSLEQAKSKILNLQLEPVIYGSGKSIVSQIPEVNQKMPKGGTVVLYTDKDSINEKVKVPKFTDLTLSAANKLASSSKLNISLKGISVSSIGSICSSQSIAEGTEVNPGTVVNLTFSQTKAENSD